MRIERRSGLTPRAFAEDWLVPGRPVVVTDALSRWTLGEALRPERLLERFGDRAVPVYDDLFQLVALSTVRAFLTAPRAVVGRPTPYVPYVRWYSRQRPHPRFPWADDVFDALAGHWSTPYVLEGTPLALPCAPTGADPARCRFPARGLYLSPAGARTRLHFDPWFTDAVLCQFHGTKRVRIVAEADRDRVVLPGRVFADLEAPDPERFPDAAGVVPFVDDVLLPGELLYLPRGCLHDVTTLTDSVSVTWNFCPATSARGLFHHLTSGAATPEELRDVESFWFDAP